MEAGRGVDPELQQGAGPSALDDNIRACDQFSESPDSGLLSEVHGDALLARVEQIEESGLASASAVGAVAALEFDHPGAAASEQLGTKRTGPERGKVENLGPFARARRGTPRSDGLGPKPRGLGGRRPQRRGYGQSHHAPALDAATHGAPAKNARGEVPGVFAGRRFGLEPGGQQVPVLGSGQVEGQPGIPGGDEPATAARGDGSLALKLHQGGAFAQQGGSVEFGEAAAPRGQGGQGKGRAPGDRSQRAGGQAGRALGFARQCHGARASPLPGGVERPAGNRTDRRSPRRRLALGEQVFGVARGPLGRGPGVRGSMPCPWFAVLHGVSPGTSIQG